MVQHAPLLISPQVSVRVCEIPLVGVQYLIHAEPGTTVLIVVAQNVLCRKFEMTVMHRVDHSLSRLHIMDKEPAPENALLSMLLLHVVSWVYVIVSYLYTAATGTW